MGKIKRDIANPSESGTRRLGVRCIGARGIVFPAAYTEWDFPDNGRVIEGQGLVDECGITPFRLRLTDGSFGLSLLL